MNESMKESIRMVVVLVIVGAISGAILAGVYKYAQPKIEAHIENLRQEAIYNVLEGTSNIKIIKHSTGEIYQGFNGNNKLIGYAFEAQGTGYQGTMILMVGLNSDLDKILTIQVIESRETPGLGSKIEDDNFRNQFRSLNVSHIDNIQAISGATISSKGVVKIAKKEIDKVREILKDYKR